MPKADIAAQGYDLSLNRYKEVVHEEVEHRPPLEIIADLERLEGEIQQGLAELKAMLVVTIGCARARCRVLQRWKRRRKSELRAF